MIRSLFLACVVVPIISVFWFAVFDYNQFISIPYWTHFSFCYLLAEDINFCSESTEAVIAEWTKAHWRWDLEAVGQHSNHPVPEIDAKDFSYELLMKVSKGVTIPVVVRGLFNDSAASQKWSPEYFRERYGENVIVVLGNSRPSAQHEVSVENSLNTNYALGKSAGYQKIMDTKKMKVSTAMNRMEKGEKLYIANIDTIFRRNNDLLDDLEFTERITPWVNGRYEPNAAQMFMGFGSEDPTQTTGTLMHCASSANFFVQVKGRKQWTFVMPRYGLFLKPSLGSITPAAKVRAPATDVPQMHLVLEAGDAFLNPPWMWHEILNKKGFTVGVATRENHPPWIARNNLLFSMLLEWRATPRVAKMVIPEEKKALRFFASIPFLSFALGYLQETVKGPQKSPLFTAGSNPCDEHDMSGKDCATSILDKVVYSEDISPIPFAE